MARNRERSTPRSDKVVSLSHADLFGSVFNSHHSLIAYLDTDLRFLLVNEAYAAAARHPAKWFQKKSCREILPVPVLTAAFEQVIESGNYLRGFETPFKLSPAEADENSYWDWSVEPVLSKDRTIGALMLTLIEVTERRLAKDALKVSEQDKETILRYGEHAEQERRRWVKVAEQSAERAESLENQLRQTRRMEALGTLAGGIAHNLNNILMPIIMNAELIAEDTDPASAVHGSAVKVLSSAHHGRDLVRRVLAFSRKREVEKSVFFAERPVLEALELIRPTLPDGVELETSVQGSFGPVEGDPSEIQETVVNLCSNAVHAVGEKRGRIRVQLSNVRLNRRSCERHAALSPGKYVHLSVSDSGTGMTEAVLDRIFDPFFTTKKPGEGTGMGLAMVHGAVRRHGGAVLVESTPGKGTVFDVYLPTVAADAETSADMQMLKKKGANAQ